MAALAGAAGVSGEPGVAVVTEPGLHAVRVTIDAGVYAEVRP